MTKRRHPSSLTGSADPPDQKYRMGEAEARPAEAGIQLEKNPMCKGYKTCTKFHLTNQSKREEDIYMGCIGLYTSWRESMVKVGTYDKGVRGREKE